MKSEVVGNIQDAKQQEAYGKKWEQIEQDLGRESFNELFNHIRMIARKAKAKESTIKEVRAYVRPSDNSIEFIDTKLVPCADAFDSIKNASYESATNAEKINSYLRWLNRVDNVDWQPPAILYFTRHSHDSSALLKFLIDLERLASVSMIIRDDVNARAERYGILLMEIESDADLTANNSALQLTEQEITCALEAINGNLYEAPRIRLHVLLYLDWTLSQASGASYDHPIVSVEHVLPQTPAVDSQWLRWFGTQENCASWVHRLANLVLLSRRKNSEATNYDFDKKKSKYFQSHNGVANFALTSQVLVESEWTPDVLKRRQNNCFKNSNRLGDWRLSGSTSSPVQCIELIFSLYMQLLARG